MVLCSISERENSHKTMGSILSTWTSGEKTKTAFSSFSLRGEEGFPYFPPPHKKKKTHFFWFLSKFTFAGSRTEAENPKSRESAISRTSFSLSTGKAVFPPDISSSSLCSTKQIWATQNNRGICCNGTHQIHRPTSCSNQPLALQGQSMGKTRSCSNTSSTQGWWELPPVLCRFTLEHQLCSCLSWKEPSSRGSAWLAFYFFVLVWFLGGDIEKTNTLQHAKSFWIK